MDAEPSAFEKEYQPRGEKSDARNYEVSTGIVYRRTVSEVVGDRVGIDVFRF